MGNRVKKMKPGKLTGPSHKRGGILLEAEGGEYIIKKSSVKKIGKAKLDKINREGKMPNQRATKVKGAAKGQKRGRINIQTHRYRDIEGANIPKKRQKKAGRKSFKGERDLPASVRLKNLKPEAGKKLMDSFKARKKQVERPKTKKSLSPQEVKAKQAERMKSKAKSAEEIGKNKKRMQKLWDTSDHPRKKAGGGKVGDSIKTYSNGGYVEGK